MARKPVHAHTNRENLTPYDRVWREIRKQRTFTTSSIEDKARVTEPSIRDYLKCLIAAGIVTCIDPGGSRDEHGQYTTGRYMLETDVGSRTPRFRTDGVPVQQGAGQRNMWRTMRMLGEFDKRELLLAATTDETALAMGAVKSYLRFLTLAGYLCVATAAKPGKAARYRFIRARYTGPKAPMVQRSKAVWDPNIAAVVWRPTPKAK